MSIADIRYIWMDGKLVEPQNATVPFLSTALHYGLSVFEGIRCYDTARGPAVFRLREHIHRLFDSAKVLGFRDIPYSESELCEAVKETVRANQMRYGYIRPLIYHDSPDFSFNLGGGSAHVGIAAWPWGAYLGEEAAEKGVRANVSSFLHHHVNVTMTKAKIGGNYVSSALAKTESIRLGFDEAIMLDPQGYVAECSGENLFLVRGKRILTPHSASILEGITRDTILTLCSDLGYTVVEEPVSRDQLYIADEVFFSGTAAELVAVTEIDFRTIGSGRMGTVTRQIQQSFGAVVRGEHPLSEGWLAYL
ncbi:branched chain amino acid aminotransferase apoenzyme [Longilinea arvoryzae]|uniref:Branched-chain-amino-acid aminotransferase n=1 Tax=Longilinea arvoryzae TaxID=360412 RepID=A0A0S7BBZ3_9CHLR|nr:branched-chain amino acid transaminase [Longilinea arvoryzae]GAP12288.1 branched chain amino acid aminotransferase apoenzyme [Longilinea arvoryzae]